MDYDNPQFAAAVKKVLWNLAHQVYENTETAYPADNSHIKEEATAPAIHELHVSDATIDKRIQRQSAQERRHTRFKDFIETLTVGIVLAYTIVAGFQWWELYTQNINQSAAIVSASATADQSLLQGRQTIRQSQQAMENQERAWVGITSELVTPNPTGAVGIPFRFIMTNTGPTPALRTRIQTGIMYKEREYLLKTDFRKSNMVLLNPEQTGKISRGSVTPNGGHGTTPTFLANIPPPQKHLFILGTLYYDDVFGHNHTTEVCYMFIENGTLTLCNLHNTMN